MKNLLVFVLFMASSILAGAGIENHNSTFLLFGLGAMMLAFLLVMSDVEEEIKSKNS